MRLTALVESAQHVCCRYRLAAFRPYLERAGHTIELWPLPRAWYARVHLGRELRRADVVILQRKLLPSWQYFCIRRAARRLIYDFDDAVFLRDSYSSKGLYSTSRQGRFRRVLRSADLVVAGNNYLEEQALPWAGPARTVVVPTCVDPGLYPVARHQRAGAGVQLTWIGSSSTLKGLEAIRPILEMIGSRRPEMSLKVICDRFLALRHLPVLACPWSGDSEGEALAAADIGVSWMPDDPWSRGKCGLKVLQYMAAGLPVVANPVGVHVDMVRHGETGFLVVTPEEWVEAVGRLADDPGLRRRMGEAARRRVEAEYSVPVGAARWAALLDRIGERRHAA